MAQILFFDRSRFALQASGIFSGQEDTFIGRLLVKGIFYDQSDILKFIPGTDNS
jgi:hypothetical protein